MRGPQVDFTPEAYIALERKAIPDAETVRTDFEKHDEILLLPSLQCDLPLQDIYERVTFPE